MKYIELSKKIKEENKKYINKKELKMYFNEIYRKFNRENIKKCN